METLKEYKSVNLESIYASQSGKSIIFDDQAYKLHFGDVFVLNDVGIKQTFNLPIKKIKLGVNINQCFLCIEKIKRKHWWQFWKSKYWGVKFMYLGTEENNYEH